MGVPPLFSAESPEIDFSLLFQGSEHAEDDLFAGLREVPLHVEENPSGVEQWLEEGELGATVPAAQPLEECAPTGRGTGGEFDRPASGEPAPRLVINLVGGGVRDKVRLDVPQSDLGFQGVPGDVTDADAVTPLESVLDEIDCVDDFGPESEDPGGESETCPGAEGLASECPEVPSAAAAVVSEGRDPSVEPGDSQPETPDAEALVSARSLARTEWYPEEGLAAPEDFDCSGVDASSTLTYRTFVGLREAFAIPSSVALLRPLKDDRPFRPRRGFAAVSVASLNCGLRLPFQPIVQQLLARLGVHACQMSPAFYRIVAMCHMEWHCQTERVMTVSDFRNLIAVFPAPGQPSFFVARDRRNTKLIVDSEKYNRRPWVWVSAEAFGDAPLRFGPLSEFPANEGADDLDFVKEIRGMSEARKAVERFRSPELMASTGWFPPFPQRTEGAPSAASSLSSGDPQGMLTFRTSCFCF